MSAEAVFHEDGLVAAKRCAEAGKCLFCDDAVSTYGRSKWLCGDDECRKAYLRAWHRDQRLRTPERYGSAFYAAKAVQP